MKRKISLSAQLYQALFPFRAQGVDPSSFSEHVRKNLLPELRTEVRMFYGEDLSDTLEARFPGLDYADRVHRFRLSRFPHHCKLFAAMDKLGWTDQEIYYFCDWEGTLLVKKKYETHHGTIRDTAIDYIHQEEKSYSGSDHPGYMRGGDEETVTSRESSPATTNQQDDDADDDDDDDDDDDYQEYHTAETTSVQRPGARQAVQSHMFDPQSALNMARQALLASRASGTLAAHAAPSLRSTAWRDRESPVSDPTTRNSRVESARAAA